MRKRQDVRAIRSKHQEESFGNLQILFVNSTGRDKGIARGGDQSGLTAARWI